MINYMFGGKICEPDCKALYERGSTQNESSCLAVRWKGKNEGRGVCSELIQNISGLSG